MQIPIIGHRGQAKPYSSIPRINWNHPLTRGLISYCYDVGSGPIDLVIGSQRVIANSTNPPFGGPKSSRYGTALSAIATSPVTVGLFNVAGNAQLDSIITATPFSWGCGFSLTAMNAFAQLYGVCNSAGSSIPLSCGLANVSTDFWWRTHNSTPQSTASGLAKFGNFQSMLGVSATSTTITGYLDGIQQVAATGLAATTDVTTASSKSFFHGVIAGTVHATATGQIFYGAVWKGRAMTASEARLLHDDPYCFLIYPEDEMFASLKGSFAGYIFSVGQNSNPPNTRMVGY